MLILTSFASCKTNQNDKQIIINLDSNPSTGYSWTLKQSGSAEAVVVDQIYTQTDRSVHMTGAPGKDTFIIEPTKSGELTLTFEYLRPWEEGIAPAEVVEYNFLINENLSYTVL